MFLSRAHIAFNLIVIFDSFVAFCLELNLFYPSFFIDRGHCALLLSIFFIVYISKFVYVHLFIVCVFVSV